MLILIQGAKLEVFDCFSELSVIVCSSVIRVCHSSHVCYWMESNILMYNFIMLKFFFNGTLISLVCPDIKSWLYAAGDYRCGLAVCDMMGGLQVHFMTN